MNDNIDQYARHDVTYSIVRTVQQPLQVKWFRGPGEPAESRMRLTGGQVSADTEFGQRASTEPTRTASFSVLVSSGAEMGAEGRRARGQLGTDLRARLDKGHWSGV